MANFCISIICGCFEIKQDNKIENKLKANQWHKKNKTQLNSEIKYTNMFIYRCFV